VNGELKTVRKSKHTAEPEGDDNKFQKVSRGFTTNGSEMKGIIAFNNFGKNIMQELNSCYPEPVLLLGSTGWGKSVICREVARIMGKDYISINAHPGMDMGMLVGMWRPHNRDGSGIEVVWEDGLLTKAIRNGAVFFFEELTRAPQEAVSRLHGVLDSANRYWSLPEAGEENVPVHKNFWFIATANPPKAGYGAQRIEKALQSRFIAQFEIDEPMADELAVVQSILENEPLSLKLVRVMEDARRHGDTKVPTRDLVQWAVMIKKGFEADRAFELAVIPKFPEKKDGLRKIVYAHF
jgi:MoxR-like ATPase